MGWHPIDTEANIAEMGETISLDDYYAAGKS